VYEETIADRRVRFRLPTGEDQEAVARLPAADAADASTELAMRCVIDVDGGEPGTTSITELEDGLGDRMADLDPQAETVIEMTCPNCGSPMSGSLDAASYLFEELAHRSRHLLREVHVLASVYHWSEADILAMTSQRRARYLELIEESIPEARW
jgi:hypothetical protein